MVAQVFTDILAKGVRSGHLPNREKAAREWFRKEARRTTNVTASQIIAQGDDNRKTQSQVGRMYMFSYIAKHRATLPYWDRFPLIFPFSKRKGMFTGINFHYLPRPQRAVLMDRLYELRNNNRFDESTKLNMSYGILKAAARYKYFKPCIHSYLTTQVQSRLCLIDPADWDTALFLKTALWVGASETEVWKDSREKVGLKRSRRPSK